MAETKPCLTCGNTITKRYTEGRKRWIAHQYCSLTCRPAWNKGLDITDERVAKNVEGGKATHFSSERTTGISNVNWKGDNASYAAKHIWITYHYGAPKVCEECCASDRKMYHWANISGEYRRDRTDWLRLCVPCHKKMDLFRLKSIH